MVATPHALAGAFASRFARTPRGAVAAGVVSHLALDRVPHTDYALANRKLLFADLAAATFLSAALGCRQRLAAAGAFGGVLPDLMMVAELQTGLRVTLPLHHANHTSIEPPVAIGVLIQLITTGILLAGLSHGSPHAGLVDRALSAGVDVDVGGAARTRPRRSHPLGVSHGLAALIEDVAAPRNRATEMGR